MKDIEHIAPDKLLNFHLQLEIYGSEELSEDFLESLDSGIQEPCIVHKEPDGTYVTLAGSRRKNGARMRGMKTVPCIVREGLSESAKRIVFLASNKQREKTTDQKIREAKEWKALFEPEAEERKLSGGGAPHVRRRSSDQAGEQVGLSGDTVDRGILVVDAIDKATAAGNTKKANAIRTTLNTKGVAPAARQVAPKKRKASPKNGKATVVKPKFDGKQILKDLGAVTRAVDLMAGSVGISQSIEHKRCIGLISQAYNGIKDFIKICEKKL